MVDMLSLLCMALVREYFGLFPHYLILRADWFTCGFQWLVSNLTLIGSQCTIDKLQITVIQLNNDTSKLTKDTRFTDAAHFRFKLKFLRDFFYAVKIIS